MHFAGDLSEGLRKIEQSQRWAASNLQMGPRPLDGNRCMSEMLSPFCKKGF